MTRADEEAGVGRPPAPRVSLHFDRPERDYGPGGTLAVSYGIDGVAVDAVRALERSVLWYTEGKGEEDLGIHHFERIEGAVRLAEAIPAGTIALRLPGSPLSYEGIIVKIRWCVRVRLYFAAGRDFVSEHVFEIGDVPPARGTVERLT